VVDVGCGTGCLAVLLPDAGLPLVSFRSTYTFASDGAVIVSDSALRFRGRDEIGSGLTAACYRVLDVRDAPDRPGREFVFLAQRDEES
jgi:hypothetical protein